MPQPGAPELVVIQVRVHAEQREAFDEWLRRYNGTVERTEGHIDYDLTRATPGFEEDWDVFVCLVPEDEELLVGTAGVLHFPAPCMTAGQP